jgi:hypothetical protein
MLSNELSIPGRSLLGVSCPEVKTSEEKEEEEERSEYPRGQCHG